MIYDILSDRAPITFLVFLTRIDSVCRDHALAVGQVKEFDTSQRLQMKKCNDCHVTLHLEPSHHTKHTNKRTLD